MIEVYEHEELMTAVFTIKVCYNEDGDQLPCSYDGVFKFATILDMGAKGVLIVKSVVESATKVTVNVLSKGMRKIVR